MELDAKPELRGMVLGIFALPFIILQYPVGRLSDRIGRYRPLILGSIGNGIMLMMAGYLGSFGLFMVIIAFFMIGVGNGFTGPPAMALVGDIVKKEDNPVGMGFFNLLGNIGIIMGPILGGILLFLSEDNFVFAFMVAGLIEFLSLMSVIVIILFIFNENPLENNSPNTET
jgi:MFS family permease